MIQSLRRARDRIVGTAPSDEELCRAVEGRPGSVASAVEALDRACGRGWPSIAQRDAFRRGLDRDPAARAALHAEAARILRREVDLLGSGPVCLGPVIDWHVDARSGHRWNARTHASRIRVEEGRGWDIKWPWELSRLQDLPPLALAWLDTADERYAAEFVALVSSWIEANPPRFGVNWACTMDVALRATSLAWAWNVLSRSRTPDAAFRARLYRALLAHGRHILEHLEWKPAFRNNHYVCDLLGLIALGVLCPGFSEARAWARFGAAELERELREQVLPDGGVAESSIPYHRLTMEAVLLAQALSPRPGTGETLARMRAFVRGYLKPDGRAPQIGDNDSGRVMRFVSRDDLDHRHLVGEVDRLFWSGPEAPSERSPPATSAALADFGLYVLRRHGWYAAIRCGRVGGAGRGAHAHNDQLSLELWYGGDVVVDPGTYLYTPDPAARNRFRSTAMHNTVEVDGREQVAFDPAALFRLPDAAGARCRDFRPDEGRFAGEHHGYAPIVHRREVVVDRAVRVIDHLEGEGRHAIRASFHLARGRVRVVAAPAGVTLATERSERSPGYGRVEPIDVARIAGTAELPCTIEVEVTA